MSMRAIGTTLAAVVILALPACREPRDASMVTVLESVAYPHPENPESEAIVLGRVENHGQDTGLVAGRVPGAKVNLRRHAFEDGRPITPMVKELPVPRGATVSMHPEGVFYDVTELAEPVEPGRTLDFVMIFHDRSELPLTVEVKPLPRARGATLSVGADPTPSGVDR